VRQFLGHWIPIDPPLQTKLGQRDHGLGVDFMVGSSAFDRGGKFRIVVGPCSRQVFYRFRGDASVHALLIESVRLFRRDPLEFDLGIILAADEIPGMRLGACSAQRLGVDTFLGSQEQREVVVELSEGCGPHVRSGGRQRAGQRGTHGSTAS
jgi:type VI secretion system protein ImpH